MSLWEMLSDYGNALKHGLNQGALRDIWNQGMFPDPSKDPNAWMNRTAQPASNTSLSDALLLNSLKK